jgi:peptide/nickel transport system substrate-binding protein
MEVRVVPRMTLDDPANRNRRTPRSGDHVAHTRCAALIIALLTLVSTIRCAPERVPQHPTAPTNAETLVRRLEADVTTLNPVISADGGERYVAKLLFTPLIYLDQELQPISGLATWNVSDDKRRYRFVLNDKATFSDRTPVRASDVLFTLTKIRDPISESYIANSFQDLDLAQTRIIDERTIDVVFHRPLATQLTRFADVYVLPEHVYARGNFRKDFNTTAVGSGPYTLSHRIPGKEIVVRRRNDYWREQPAIRTVHFKVISSHETAWNALTLGQIDESIVTSDTWERERTNPAWKDRLDFRMSYTPNYSCIAWNGRHPLLRDKRVRRALGMAVPVEAMVQHLYHGTARAISGPFTPSEDAYNHDVGPLPYAPDQAKRLLADAGWHDQNSDGVLEKDGRTFDLVLQVMGDNRVAQLVQAEFARIGVKLTISTMDPASAIPRILAGNYDAAYLAWELDADPDLYSTFHSSQIPPRGRNFVYYKNPVVDRLIEEARAEFSRAKRQQLHHQLHAILAEDQPYTWTVQVAVKRAMSKRLLGTDAPRGTDYFLWYPGELGWSIDPHDPRQEDPSTQATKPPLSHESRQHTSSWIEQVSVKFDKTTMQSWFWVVRILGPAAALYAIGITAILLRAWKRGSRFVARSRLRKAALAPLRVLPAFARWILLLGYDRRLAKRTSTITATYFGLPAALDDDTHIVADMTGTQLHDTVAATVAPQRPLFVTGPGGSGKSTLLARLAYLGATHGLPSGLRGYVPVLVDAADYDGDLVIAIGAALRDRHGVDAGDDPETVIDLLQSGKFLILFDGLSEIFGDKEQAFHEIVKKAGSAALRPCRVIVATRHLAGEVHDARVIELQPLTTPVIEKVLDRYELSVAARNRVRSQIAHFSDGSVEPLLFTMMIEASGDEDLTPNRAALYERYFRRQLKVKTQDEWLGWSDALEMLATAFVLPAGRRGFGMTHAQLINYLDGRREGTANEETTASRLRRLYGIKASDALGILNTLASARILARDRRIRFAHDTFEEYFLARAIVSHVAEKGSWSPSEWYREPHRAGELLNVARFVAELSDDIACENIFGPTIASLAADWRFDEYGST